MHGAGIGVQRNGKGGERCYDENIQRRGPVAQLGARFHGMEEVKGSNPFRSTKRQTNLTKHRLAKILARFRGVVASGVQTCNFGVRRQVPLADQIYDNYLAEMREEDNATNDKFQ